MTDVAQDEILMFSTDFSSCHCVQFELCLLSAFVVLRAQCVTSFVETIMRPMMITITDAVSFCMAMTQYYMDEQTVFFYFRSLC